MRFRFILSETWTSLRRNVPMLLSVMLVTFISFLFIGASLLTQAQITKAKGDWYDKVEVVVWLCPGRQQSVCELLHRQGCHYRADQRAAEGDPAGIAERRLAGHVHEP